MTMVVVLALFASSQARKMEATIQEAIYLFEMKGDFNEAVKLLEKAAKDGDENDQEQAYFYLGKIQELSDNKSSANFYYTQSLLSTNETSLAYWLAEREAATSNHAEKLLSKPIPLPSPIKKTFGKDPSYLLLQNGSIKKISKAGIQNQAINIPPESEILHISKNGAWIKQNNEDSLCQVFFHPGIQNQCYGITGVESLFEYENQIIIQSRQGLVLIDKRGGQTTIPEKYDNCSIEGFFSQGREFVMNCPDNSIHFISAENGSESRVISLFDIVQKILIDKKFVYIISGNTLYCYTPKSGTVPLWKISVGSVEEMQSFEKNIVLLEASGRVSLIDKYLGKVNSSILTETSIISPLAKGTLGLFTGEGAVIAVDTLLRPLWIFNFTKPIEKAPILASDAIYLDFGENKLYPIAPRYYGKKKLQSYIQAQKAANLIDHEAWDSLPPVLDTLFKLEPGNAEGWFFKALLLEKNGASDKQKQQAWSEAVRLSISNPLTSQLIFNRYSKSIGAKFVSLLPISPKTLYPQFFGNKKNLFTIDPAAEQLFCINSENGEVRWVRSLEKLDNNPVIGSDESILAIGNRYNLSLYDLSRTGSPSSLQLPGKPFEIKVFENAIYVSTWNGFLLKINRPDNKLSWSRKIFSVPFLLAKDGDTLHLCNLEGTLQQIEDISGQIKEGNSKRIGNNISQMELVDSTIVFAVNGNKFLIHNLHNPESSPIQILTESPVTSMQIVNNNDKKSILVNLANQAMLLYTTAGAPLWKFQGKNSVFSKPFVKGQEIWLDQGQEIVSIDIKDGKILRHFSTPGGAGSPFVTNNILFSASPKRILYGFSL